LTKFFIRSFLSSDEKKLLIENYNLGLLITDSMFFEYATLEEAYPVDFSYYKLQNENNANKEKNKTINKYKS